MSGEEKGKRQPRLSETFGGGSPPPSGEEGSRGEPRSRPVVYRVDKIMLRKLAAPHWCVRKRGGEKETTFQK